jgi:hypothetical protein
MRIHKAVRKKMVEKTFAERSDTKKVYKVSKCISVGDGTGAGMLKLNETGWGSR